MSKIAIRCLILCALPSITWAGAMSLSNGSLTIQFPSAVVNQFGYSGPITNFSDPMEVEEGDAHITSATKARISTLQNDPLIVLLKAGPIEMETTNEGFTPRLPWAGPSRETWRI